MSYDRIARKYSPLWIFLAICLTIFAIWLPFGFSLTGLIEEWGILGLFTKFKLFFLAQLNGVIAVHALRPFTILPHSIAYFLDSNSFDFWQYSLALSILFKGLGCGYLIWFLTRSESWALIASVFIIIYPADTMQFSFRALHINWAISFMIMACSAWIYGFEQKNNWISIFFGMLAGFLFISSMFMYEAVVPLFLMPYLILYVQYGFNQIFYKLNQKKYLSVTWLLVVIIWLFFAKYISSKITTYQMALVNSEMNPNKFAYFHELAQLFYIVLLRGLCTGWLDAFKILLKEWSGLGYLYLTLVVSSIFSLFYFLEKEKSALRIAKNTQVRMLFVGFLIFTLGIIAL